MTFQKDAPELDLAPLSVEGYDPISWNTENWSERVVVVNVDTLTWEELTDNVLPYFSCVILGPGPGTPHKESDFSWPTRLIEEYGSDLPILGWCLGHQGLATTFGGQVVRAGSPRHGQTTRIHHDGDPLFKGCPPTFEAVQYNSLVVSREQLPKELQVIAWTESGPMSEIMALRHKKKPLWGIQFHPESILSRFGSTILSNFLHLSLHYKRIKTCEKHRFGRIPPSIMALSTSYRPKPTNGIPASLPLPNPGPSCLWEQRTVSLGKYPEATVARVFEKCVKGTSSLGEIWLDSARSTVSAQQSHIFTPQITWSYTKSSNSMQVRHVDHAELIETSHLQPSETFFDFMASTQAGIKRQTSFKTGQQVPIGFVGYIGYEMAGVTLASIGSKPLAAASEADAEFAFAANVLSFSHADHTWRASALVQVGDGGCDFEALREKGAKATCRFGLTEDEWVLWLTKVQEDFKSMHCTSKASEHSLLHPIKSVLKPDSSREDYINTIGQARESIIDGNAYELCLTTQFRGTVPHAVAADPFQLYLKLRQANPAPYSSYFRLLKSDISLLSSSPERFLQISASGLAQMKPIKGTVRRSDDPLEDSRRKAALEVDEKERAENLMIVDLSRNDLLGFCEVESVKVPHFMVVESFQTVHQLVTSIEGQLMPGVNPFAAVARSFPPGSMTGAPKLRSVQLLQALEGHRSRGPYSGVFGYVAIDGTTDFSVIIRTLIIRGTDVTLGAGGAITHLSDPTKEWDEVLVKVEAVAGQLFR